MRARALFTLVRVIQFTLRIFHFRRLLRIRMAASSSQHTLLELEARVNFPSNRVEPPDCLIRPKLKQDLIYFFKISEVFKQK